MCAVSDTLILSHGRLQNLWGTTTGATQSHLSLGTGILSGHLTCKYTHAPVQSSSHARREALSGKLSCHVQATSLDTCRVAFGQVVGRCKELMEYIAQQGPSAVLDVDDLLLREAMDVIGERQSMRSHIYCI